MNWRLCQVKGSAKYVAEKNLFSMCSYEMMCKLIIWMTVPLSHI